MGAKSASERLKLDVSAVYKITNSFFSKFSGLQKWMQSAREVALANGYATTILGRRRYLPAINSTDHQERAKAGRQAVNTVIQGSASDLLKHAMLRIEQLLGEKYCLLESSNGGISGATTQSKKFAASLRPRLLLQVHDELIYEVPMKFHRCRDQKLIGDPNIIEFSTLLVHYMTDVIVSELNFLVPLKVNVTVGFNWGQMFSINPNSAPHCDRDKKEKYVVVGNEGERNGRSDVKPSIGKRSVD